MIVVPEKINKERAKMKAWYRDGKLFRYIFFCPGCRNNHFFNDSWTFNGDLEHPTVNPSILVNGDDPLTRCHSYIRDGKIQFLDDCHHALKGQTVELEPFE